MNMLNMTKVIAVPLPPVEGSCDSFVFTTSTGVISVVMIGSILPSSSTVLVAVYVACPASVYS